MEDLPINFHNWYTEYELVLAEKTGFRTRSWVYNYFDAYERGLSVEHAVEETIEAYTNYRSEL